MFLSSHITLAADIGDFIWLIFIVIMVIGSVISSIFKAIKETAEKNKRRQVMEREATQVGGQSPRTASQRIQELAEQRRKQLEQTAAERRRQLQEMARERQGGGATTAAPAAPRPAPAPGVESEYDRQMRQRQEAAEQHQQELERRREQERAAAQQRQQDVERRHAEAAREPRRAPGPRKVAPPARSSSPPPPARQEAAYRKLELTEEITADMIVRDDAPGHEEPVHRHVHDAPQVTQRAKSRVAVPRLDHPTRLRQAMMIKEILDRPLALRDDEHDAYRW